MASAKRDTHTIHTNNSSMRSPKQETVPKRIWVMRRFSAPIFSTMYSNADGHSDFFLTPQNGATTRRRLHNNTWKPIFRYIQSCGYHFSVFDYVAATNQQPWTPSTYFKKCWSCRLPNSMNMTYKSHTSSRRYVSSKSNNSNRTPMPGCVPDKLSNKPGTTMIAGGPGSCRNQRVGWLISDGVYRHRWRIY